MDATDFRPDVVSLGSLFTGRLFRIPAYQRAYSWQSKHRQALFDDIRRTGMSCEPTTHFMATVVGLRREAVTIIADEHRILEIVDGQQRITTLILIFKAISKALHRSKSGTPERHVYDDIVNMLVKSDKISTLLLRTNHDSSEYFLEYIRDSAGRHADPDVAKTAADRELLTAIVQCERFVENWQKSRSLIDLVTHLKNRLKFILYEVSDEKLVYSVFEVLNSRGLDVSWFDRLKSMLMAIVFESESGTKKEHIKEIQDQWSGIYGTVGLRLNLSTESLRFAATLLHTTGGNRPLNEEISANFLVERSKSDPKVVIETTKWVRRVTEALDDLLRDRRRNGVTHIGHARLVAVAVNLRQDVNSDDKARVLVSVRLWGYWVFTVVFCVSSSTA